MKTLMTSLLLASIIAPTFAAEKDTRCFEMRIYYAAPGKLDDLQARFRNHTLKLFEKHGMTNLGYWVPLENPENKLIYLLAYPSREAREKAWKAFGADPAWQTAWKASEANGKLVSKAEVKFLAATDYSPYMKASAQDPERCFELRTYTAAPGKLADLNNRFRDHTLALFAKHGMTSVGYWTPTDKGSENTLIYILAHKSKEAAKASFDAFREDPAWVAAKTASETKGTLAAKVESVFMKPADYSPTK
jgi:hypothetical protein